VIPKKGEETIESLNPQFSDASHCPIYSVGLHMRRGARNRIIGFANIFEPYIAARQAYHCGI
jgi:hypothetical protein